MTWRAIFGSLFRGRRDIASSFGSDWGALLAQLGLPTSAFDELLAAGSLHPHFHYRHFTRPKRGGGHREIVEPDTKLKQVQREILARYLVSEQPHVAAVAYRKKKSIADHVWAHVGAEVLVTADVQDFFPSTREERVLDWWHARAHDNLARLLTLLTTYRGELPQGAPTSPALSNLLNHELDERLTLRAEVAGARYTRYCDDMVFSWLQAAGPPSDFEIGVRAVLHEFGYCLHPEKGWRVHHRRDEPEITGVILTRHGRVRLPDDLRQTMRELARSKDTGDLHRLAGFRGYASMVTTKPRRFSPPRVSRSVPERAPTWGAAPPMTEPEFDDEFDEPSSDSEEEIPF